jgi:hypothetical protein
VATGIYPAGRDSWLVGVSVLVLVLVQKWLVGSTESLTPQHRRGYEH